MNILSEELLEGLNESQKLAVSHRDGALLVVAGAGTGKTRVITKRVAALIATGVDPYHILAITFTNKAALEMRQRVEQLIGLTGVTVTTYHSFCARFLRLFSERIGFTRDYTIYDRDECLSLTNQILKSESLKLSSFTPAQLVDRVSGFKQAGLSPAAALEFAMNPRDKEVVQFYRIYDLKMRQANSMDFDDLLMKTAELLKKDQEVLEIARARYRYLLIDEYQDTNQIQYEIVRLIGHHGNVCATGDPDQSIYAWRGADIRNILEFEKDFPEATVVLLEENYRSTGCILKAASAVIANNLERKKRDLWTKSGDGDPLKLTVLDDERGEAREVASLLKVSRDQGNAWAHHAVFYRTNAQTRVLERALRESHIPYRLVGAVSFFKRKEIKDLLAYLTLLVNPKDNQSFMRVINTPKRGLGKTTLDRLRVFAEGRGLSLFESLNYLNQVEGLTNRAHKNLEGFLKIFSDLQDEENPRVRNLLMQVLELTQYESSLDGDADRVERIENIRELVTAAQEYDLNHPEGSLSDFLADVSLMTSSENEEGDSNGVVLMTLHSAKGLEFDHVYFVGLEEELLPHIRSRDDPKDIEEERRLMYVGITRARKTLSLFYCQARSSWGHTRWTRPSRFLSEVPEAILETTDKSTASQFEETVYEEQADTSHHWESDYFEVDQEKPVAVGDRVSHSKFGTGQVLTVSGSPGAHKVRIKFLTVGVRQIIWERAPVEKV